MTRRNVLLTGAAAIGAMAWLAATRGGPARAAEQFSVTHTDAEWRTKLTPEAYDVLRRQGTEAPGSSPLDHEFAPGRYDCAGCALPLFASAAKFDSGTGWPSFFAPLPHAISTESDTSLMMDRTEVHCARCGGEFHRPRHGRHQL